MCTQRGLWGGVVLGLAALFVMVAGQAKAASLVGVSFSSSSSGPTNWTHVTSGGSTSTATINNLIDQNGNQTSFSLTFTAPGASYFPGTPTASTVPINTPTLALSGNVNGNGSTDAFSATIGGLAANSLYDVWVFGVRFQSSSSESVTVTGSGTFLSFNQTGAAGFLNVNEKVGSSTSPLASYADQILSSASGTILITANGFNGGSYGVAGIAIEQVQTVPEPTSLVLLGLGIAPFAVWRGIVRNRTIPT